MSSLFPNTRRGFTLIELLVVIAIIGILSSVVLVSLNTARNRSNDAAIKSSLSDARPQAELFFYANTNSYMVTAGATTDVCSSTGLAGTVKGIYSQVLSAARAYGGSAATVGATATASTYKTSVCHSSATAWAAWVPLSSSASGSIVAWCVDSIGKAKQVNAVLARNATACP